MRATGYPSFGSYASLELTGIPHDETRSSELVAALAQQFFTRKSVQHKSLVPAESEDDDAAGPSSFQQRCLDLHRLLERASLGYEQFQAALEEEFERLETRYLCRDWDKINLMVEANSPKHEREREAAEGAVGEGDKAEERERLEHDGAKKEQERDAPSNDGEEEKDLRIKEKAKEPESKKKRRSRDDIKCMWRLTEENQDRLLSRHRIVFLCFFAPYCPYCVEMADEFECLAEWLQQPEQKRMDAICCVADGTTDHKLAATYCVTSFPSLILFRNGKLVSRYPQNAKRTAEAFLNFIQQEEQDSKASAHDKAEELWKMALERWRIYKLHKELQPKRQERVSHLMIEALKCHDEESCSRIRRPLGPEHPPPTIFFLGGGMGAGKTTVLQQTLAKTPFLEAYGSQVVTVQADTFKENDPIYKALKRRDGQNYYSAGAVVHEWSTQTAEELFLSAVLARRDIIFDGTMTWKPFVEQCVAMVRDNQHVYKRGPGIVLNDDGKVIKEQYWEIVSSCSEMIPYRIEAVAVAVYPHIATKRAILRRFRDGRDVPFQRQLRSHKLFCANFADYLSLFDSASLYENNGATPQLIARKDAKDGPALWTSDEAWPWFRDVKHINTEATNIKQLYWLEEEEENKGCGEEKKETERGSMDRPEFWREVCKEALSEDVPSEQRQQLYQLLGTARGHAK